MEPGILKKHLHFVHGVQQAHPYNRTEILFGTVEKREYFYPEPQLGIRSVPPGF
jgi:hypothetical protein